MKTKYLTINESIKCKNNLKTLLTYENFGEFKFAVILLTIR